MASSDAELLVSRDEELDGLGCLVADLLTDNLEDGRRRRLLDGRRCATTITVVDAESFFVVELGAGHARVLSAPQRRPSLRIRLDGDTLVSLPEVPLVFGLPDPRTVEGRALIGRLGRRELRIGGLLLHLAQVRRLLNLLNTSATTEHP